MNKTIFLLISVAIFSLVLVDVAKATENKNEVLIIINAEDISGTREIVDFMRSNGGEVAQVFIPRAIIGEISDELEQKILNKYSSDIVVIYHDAVDIPLSEGTIEQPAIRYWNSKWNSKFEPKFQIMNIENDPGPILNDALIPLDRVQDDNFKIGTFSQAPPSDIQTSEYLYGDVLASIILLESNGSTDTSIEDWTSAEETNVDNEIAAALNWWIARKPSKVNLTFWVYANHYKIPIKYEPINRPSSNEDLWINEAMDHLSVSSGNYFSRVRKYADTIRDANNMNWAFTIFVVDSSTDANGEFTDGYFAYAYLGGPFLVMTYDNGGYGISNMDAVTAHETGHIFGAADQYVSYAYDPPVICSCNSKYGFLQVENQNCENSCLSNVASIMRGEVSPFTNSAVDYYAKGQIGWRDLDGDGINDAIDSTYNSDTDTDGDGVVDYWDGDDDNDGTIDTTDNCPTVSGPSCNNGCPDLTPPLSSITYPPNNSFVKGAITIRSNETDACLVTSSKYRVDNNAWNSMSLSGNIATSSINTKTYPDGAHTIYVRGTDEYGNAENTASITLTFDNTPPALIINSPRNTTYNSKSVWANVTLNEAGSWCERSLAGAANLTMNGSGTLWHSLITSLSDGDHTVTFYCNDTAGNTNLSSINFEIDATPPIINITTPTNDSIVTKSSFWFNITTNENANCTYQLSLCGASQSSSSPAVSTMAGGSGGGGGGGCGGNSLQNMSATGSKNHSQLIAGINDTTTGQNYRLTAACTDSAENANSSSVRFYVDTKPPIIAVHSPLNKSHNKNDLPINVSISELVQSIKRSLDGGENITLCSACKNHNSTNLMGLSEGKHNLTIYATDYVNNSADLTVAFSIDTVFPLINITSLVNGSKLTNSSFWVNAITNENASCAYNLCKLAENEGGAWRVGNSYKNFELSESLSAGSSSAKQETIRNITTFITDDELRNTLADGTFRNGKGNFSYHQYMYFDPVNTQTTTAAASLSVVYIEDPDTDVTTDYFYVKNGDRIATYSLEFVTNTSRSGNQTFKSINTTQSNITDGNGSATTSGIYLWNFEGKEINLLGKTYSIAKARRTSSNGNGAELTLMSGSAQIFLKDTDISSRGAGSQPLEVGSKIINDTKVTITGSDDNTTFSIDTIELNITADDDFYVPAGGKLSEQFEKPEALLSSWDIAYEGLEDVPSEKIRIKTSASNQYYLEFVDGNSNSVSVPLAYTPGGSNLTLGDNANALVITENTTIAKDDYFIVTDISQQQGERRTYAVRYKGASAFGDSEPVVKFQILGEYGTKEEVLSDSGALPLTSGADATLKFGGATYNLWNATGNTADFGIMVDLNGNGVTENVGTGDLGNIATANIINVTTKSGAQILIQPFPLVSSYLKLASAVPMTAINISIQTPNSSDYDNRAPTPVDFDITAVSGMVNFAENTGFHGDHNYRSPQGESNTNYAYTTMGAKVKWNNPPNEPDTLEIDYPRVQRLPLLYVTSYGATVSNSRGSECVASQQQMTGNGSTTHSRLFQNVNDTPSNQRYLLALNCTDSASNRNTTSLSFYLDATAPALSNIRHSFVTNESAIISWNLSESSNGTLEYGLTGDYGSSISDTLYRTLQKITLTGLQPVTTYHYRVKSSDSFGNENVSKDFTFRTSVAENIKQTIPANEITTVSSSATNTTLDIVVRGNVANAAINLTSGRESPTNKSLNVSRLKYLNIDVDNSLSQVLASVLIKIHYTDEEISAQNLTESSLGIYLYNSTLDEWVKLDSSMDWVFGTGVDEASNYVWANVSHFSSYGAGGLIANGYSCSSSSQCSSGLCSNNVCSNPSSGGDSPSGGGSSGGGGGGGGGGGASLTSETVTVDSILAGSTETFRFTKSESFAIYEIGVTALNEKTGVSLKVSEANLASGTPFPVSQSTGKVYKQLSINKQGIGNDDITKALVRFKVASSWTINNSINPESVALYRYSGGSWEKLPTRTVSNDAKSHYYESDTPGFSIFAIVGEFGNIPERIMAPSEENKPVSESNEEAEPDNADESEEEEVTEQEGEQGLLGKMFSFITGRAVAETGAKGKTPLWPSMLLIILVITIILRWKKVKFGPLYFKWYVKKLGFKKT